MGGLRLNAEYVPDKGKRRDERSILGSHYDETDPNDGIRRRGLDEHRDHACIHCRHFWGECLPRKRSHLEETKAYHRGDDDIQAHAERDPRDGDTGNVGVRQR